MVICPECKNEVHKRYNRYCSNRCQTDYQYRTFIDLWKAGKVDGGIGVSAKRISGHVSRYIHGKFGDKCTLCGWGEIHPVTHKVPLEIDHIDGDSENNTEANLRLLCPNCHALTPNFRNLNKGKGRQWRKAKYIRN